MDPVGVVPPFGSRWKDRSVASGVRLPEDWVTTCALGEETADGIIICYPHRGNVSSPGHRLPPGIATTLALGEETGDGLIHADPPEEGSCPPRPCPPPGWVTTHALGEETAAGFPVTTQALGEEGGAEFPITTKALGEEGEDGFEITTSALGEEGGEDAWRWERSPVDGTIEPLFPFLPPPVVEDGADGGTEPSAAAPLPQPLWDEGGRPIPHQEPLAVEPPTWPIAAGSTSPSSAVPPPADGPSPADGPVSAGSPSPADIHLPSLVGLDGATPFVADAATLAEPDSPELPNLDLHELRVASSWLQQVYGSARSRRESAFPLTVAPPVQSPNATEA